MRLVARQDRTANKNASSSALASAGNVCMYGTNSVDATFPNAQYNGVWLASIVLYLRPGVDAKITNANEILRALPTLPT